MEIPCPTCGAVNEEPCIRGRKPHDVVIVGEGLIIPEHWGGITGAVWRKGELLGRNHDSRNSANKKAED